MTALGLTFLVVAVVSVGVLTFSWRLGHAAFAAATLAGLDIGLGAALEKTSLYVNATYSQPALRAQGAAMGFTLLVTLVGAIIWGLFKGSPIKATPLDRLVAGLGGLALLCAAVGAARGNQLVFIAGDTYRILVVVGAYGIVRILACEVEDGTRVVVALGTVAACATALQAVEVVRIILGAGNLNGAGHPPLILLAILLALVATGSLTHRRMRWCGLAVVAVVGMCALSLTRGIWVATAVAVAVALSCRAGASTIRVARYVLLPGVVVAVVASIAVGAVSPGVAAQFSARVDELRGDDGVVTLQPAMDTVSSVDERLWEVRDSVDFLWELGPTAWALGAGLGGEYPTALDRIENTSREGQRHQIHVTWVSVLFRQGVLGLGYLVVLLVSIGVVLVRAAIRQPDGVEAWVPLALLIWLSAEVLALTNAYGLFGQVAWGICLGAIGTMSPAQVRRSGV